MDFILNMKKERTLSNRKGKRRISQPNTMEVIKAGELFRKNASKAQISPRDRDIPERFKSPEIDAAHASKFNIPSFPSRQLIKAK